MRRMKFRRGATVRKLAKEWDLSTDQLEKLTAAANKRVRAEFSEDQDRVVAKVGPALERIIDDSIKLMSSAHAIAKESPDGVKLLAFDPTRAHTSIINAAKVINLLAGVNAPTVVKVDDGGLPESPEDRAKFYRALAEREESKLSKGDE